MYEFCGLAADYSPGVAPGSLVLIFNVGSSMEVVGINGQAKLGCQVGALVNSFSPKVGNFYYKLLQTNQRMITKWPKSWFLPFIYDRHLVKFNI